MKIIHILLDDHELEMLNKGASLSRIVDNVFCKVHQSKYKEQRTFTQLQEQFEQDVKDLQEHCKHKPSKWMDFMWAPGHFSPYKIKTCHICGKIVDQKGQCYQCGCVTTNKNADMMSGYCNKCHKKLKEQFKQKGKELTKLVREEEKKVKKK